MRPRSPLLPSVDAKLASATRASSVSWRRCQVPATRCDLDHETPWPRGETAVGNLHAKHRWHHNIKTDGIWTSRPVPDDGLEWTTLTGRTYTTHPKNWRPGLGPPHEHPHPQPQPERPATPATPSRAEDDPPPF